MTPEPSGQSAVQQILTRLDASNARANAATPLVDAMATDGWSGDATCVSVDDARKLELQIYKRDEAIRELIRGLDFYRFGRGRRGKFANEALTRTLAILKGESNGR